MQRVPYVSFSNSFSARTKKEEKNLFDLYVIAVVIVNRKYQEDPYKINSYAAVA